MFALRTSLSHVYRAHPRSRILAISTRWTALIRFMTMPLVLICFSYTLLFPLFFVSGFQLTIDIRWWFIYVTTSPRLIPVVKPSDPAGLLFIFPPLFFLRFRLRASSCSHRSISFRNAREPSHSTAGRQSWEWRRGLKWRAEIKGGEFGTGVWE